jgi:hypothetical protein
VREGRSVVTLLVLGGVFADRPCLCAGNLAPAGAYCQLTVMPTSSWRLSGSAILPESTEWNDVVLAQQTYGTLGRPQHPIKTHAAQRLHDCDRPWMLRTREIDR